MPRFTWRDFGARVWNQVQQTALPILAAIVAAPEELTSTVAVIGVLSPIVITAIKAALAALLDFDYPGVVLDRVIPAVAGVLVAFVPLMLADLLTVNWVYAAIAAVAAGVAALIDNRIQAKPAVQPR
jgi:hypothetical protein